MYSLLIHERIAIVLKIIVSAECTIHTLILTKRNSQVHFTFTAAPSGCSAGKRLARAGAQLVEAAGTVVGAEAWETEERPSLVATCAGNRAVDGGPGWNRNPRARLWTAGTHGGQDRNEADWRPARICCLQHKCACPPPPVRSCMRLENFHAQRAPAGQLVLVWAVPVRACTYLAPITYRRRTHCRPSCRVPSVEPPN
jgi:hypothetical protein